jgi:hypothetical protein
VLLRAAEFIEKLLELGLKYRSRRYGLVKTRDKCGEVLDDRSRGSVGVHEVHTLVPRYACLLRKIRSKLAVEVACADFVVMVDEETILCVTKMIRAVPDAVPELRHVGRAGALPPLTV